ncbi:MAG: class I SAM-dependent methyltransferase [Chloroflexi bacterium]|nr:MAG: class I SAM-dependent methyltransferase [Chloroflexota bacterium]
MVARARPVPIYREVTGQIDTHSTPTLDVGCGNNKIPGAVGIDLVAGPQIDIVHDLDETPWPLESNAFQLIRLWSVIEHLRDLVATMEEVHRVARPGAMVLIGTPHFSSANAYTDPTHIHFLSGRFLDYFIEGTELAGHYGFYSKVRFRLEERRVTLSPFWARLRITRLMNRILPAYETYLCGLIRGADIQLKLTVVK